MCETAKTCVSYRKSGSLGPRSGGDGPSREAGGFARASGTVNLGNQNSLSSERNTDIVSGQWRVLFREITVRKAKKGPPIVMWKEVKEEQE